MADNLMLREHSWVHTPTYSLCENTFGNSGVVQDFFKNQFLFVWSVLLRFLKLVRWEKYEIRVNSLSGRWGSLTPKRIYSHGCSGPGFSSASDLKRQNQNQCCSLKQNHLPISTMLGLWQLKSCFHSLPQCALCQGRGGCASSDS